MTILNGYGTIQAYGKGSYKGSTGSKNIVIKLLIEQYKRPMINRENSLTFEVK